ncbi:MAG: hypothetical protein E7469_01470 [Ruminococcaceae bacterium]|nr:hypothetical protein [Oscillospiraceae bacterium]
MTLLEMSRQYHDDALVFAARIHTLQHQEATERDPRRRQKLHRRIVELTPLLRQSRALEQVTEHYYDRGARKHAYYQL